MVTIDLWAELFMPDMGIPLKWGDVFVALSILHLNGLS
jgi:hypothetical protein